MLTPNYINSLPNGLIGYYEELENELLREIIHKMKDLGKIDTSGFYSLETLVRLDYNISDIERYLSKETNKTQREVKKLIQEASLQSYENDKYLYRLAGKWLPELKSNIYLQGIINQGIQDGMEDFNNLTRTLGFEGKPLSQYYHKKLSQGVVDIQSGAYTYDSTIKKIINEMSNRGITTVDYKSGRTLSVESAIRMSLKTSIGNISRGMGLSNAKMMGQDLMEITAHSGARPSHADWQGHIVSMSGRDGYLSLGDIGYGDITGFGGINCYHDWFPFFEDLSYPSWSEFDLDNIDSEPFEYEDKEYTQYEAKQRQRYFERSIRKSKRKIIMYNEAELNKELAQEKIKLREKNKRYKEFSSVAGLKRQSGRLYIK